MRFALLWICCLSTQATAASVFRSVRHSHGTVSERHAALRHARSGGQQLPDVAAAPPSLDPSSMKMSPTASATVPKPLSADTPESMANVMGYEIAMPTPMPAPFNGQFCKGGACQYRVVPPPPIPPTPLPILPPPMPIGGNLMSGKEFCRGLTCLGGMGMPGDPKLALWNGNCLRLYNDIAGGMVGDDASRTVTQAYQSFLKVCQLRVGPLEVGACPAYANTIIGSESPKVHSTTVGGAMEVCTDQYWFTLAFKQAEIDLKLNKAALPKEQSLLSIALNRLGTGGVGPSSPRGLKWREWAFKRHRYWAPPLNPQQLAPDGSAVNGPAFMQMNTKADPTPKPTIPGADSDEDTPRGVPKYDQNPPCNHDTFDVKQSKTKYQIAPGSPDGTVPPVEVDGDLFNYCANQFSEIMMGFAQTAPVTVQMTKDWCSWQASVSSWVGKQAEFGHPDWDHRTCANMQMFMAFVLKDDLKDKASGLGAQQICKKIFLTIGAVHRSESIIHEAWVLQSTRAAPEGGGIPSGSDDGMKDLMKQAQDYASKIFSAMRKQKTAFEDLNNAKMDTAAFDVNKVEAPAPPPAPDLPDSDDIDPAALMELSVAHVRENTQAGIGVSQKLTPWGQGESDAK